jgi:CRP-like cAMP-binding protein
VLQLPASSFAALVGKQPAFAQAVVHALGNRLRIAEARIIRELQTKRVERRIARALLRLDWRTEPTSGRLRVSSWATR